jgi:hypothetical protein
MVQRMKQLPDQFHLIWPEPECVNVCFWYIPKRLRQLPHSSEKEQELGRVSRLLLSFAVFRHHLHRFSCSTEPPLPRKNI